MVGKWSVGDNTFVTRCVKVYGLFFLDCTSLVLIGWAGKLQSYGYIRRLTRIAALIRLALASNSTLSAFSSSLLLSSRFFSSSFAASVSRKLVSRYRPMGSRALMP